MIIGLILRLIKKVIDLISAIVAWLFVTLGLWVPFVYCLVFVIVCAIKGVELSSVSVLFFFGLFLSLFASVALSVYLAGRKFKKREKRSDVVPALGKRKDKVILKNSATDDEIAERTDGADSVALIKNGKKSKKEEKTDVKEEAVEEKKTPVNIIEAAKADAERKLIEDGYANEENTDAEQPNKAETLFEQDAEKAYDYEKPKPEPQPSKESEVAPVVTKGGYNPSEMPRIFATRKDPTVFIYEYKSRLDFYKRTRSGMIYMYTEYKS